MKGCYNQTYMKSIKVTAKLFRSPLGNSCWVRATSPRFSDAIGIGGGVHYAINDFIECFNEMKFLDKDGKEMHIDHSDIILKRPFQVEYITYMPFRTHEDYLRFMNPCLDGIFEEGLTLRTPEQRVEGMPILVQGFTDERYRKIDMSREACLRRIKEGYY